MSGQKRFFSFGFKVFVLITGCILLSNSLLYFLTDYGFGVTYYNSLVVLNIIKRSALTWTFTIGASIYVAAVALVAGASLLVSHRISGPMYRFEKTAEALAEGDLTVSARLRGPDFLKEQSLEFDDAIAGLRRRISRAAELKGELERRVERLSGYVEAGGPEGEVSELVAEIISISRELENQMELFRVNECI